MTGVRIVEDGTEAGFVRFKAHQPWRLLMSELIPYSQQSSEVAPTGVGALVERKASPT